MIRRPPRSTHCISSAASDVYKRQVIALAWFGIRTGERWAFWTALFAPVVAIVLALPLHYVYGLATLGHLGLIYLDVAILLIGIVVAHRGLAR